MVETHSSLLLRQIHQRRTDTRCENDISKSLLLEDSRRRLRRVERAVEVDLHDLAPLFRGILLSRPVGGNAGVGNDDVQLAKVCGDLLDGALDVGLVPHVGLVRGGADAVG